jgi:hypothetical protein
MTSATRRRLAVAVLTALSLLCISSFASTAGHARQARRPAVRATGRDTVPHAVAAYDSAMGDSVSEGELFMAWHAPYGMKGARSDLTFACDDTGRVDTLYLSFDTGRNLPEFMALFARLYLTPASGDTLGMHWRYAGGDTNNRGLVAQMELDSTFPCVQPWRHRGAGATRYDFEPFRGELTMLQGVALLQGAPVKAGRRYCFARLLFKHSLCHLAGASQPLCIEWVEAQYASGGRPFTGGGRDFWIRRGPGRFVTINSPDGSVCAPYRSPQRLPRWLPNFPPPPQEVPAPAAPPDTVAKVPVR